LNVAGGLSIPDPSADLAVCASLASALRDRLLRGDACYLGEVGLAGEVRPVARLGARLREAERLDLKHAFVSSREREYRHDSPAGLEVEKADNLSDVL
jgi:DNA repair protein RadA/Sms